MQDSPTQPLPQLDDFTAYLINQRRLSPISVSAYRYAVVSFLSHLREIQTDAQVATSEIILRYLDQKKRDGLRPATLFLATVAIRHFYRFLHGQGEISTDPTLGIRLPGKRWSDSWKHLAAHASPTFATKPFWNCSMPPAYV